MFDGGVGAAGTMIPPCTTPVYGVKTSPLIGGASRGVDSGGALANASLSTMGSSLPAAAGVGDRAGAVAGVVSKSSSAITGSRRLGGGGGDGGGGGGGGRCAGTLLGGGGGGGGRCTGAGDSKSSSSSGKFALTGSRRLVSIGVGGGGDACSSAAAARAVSCIGVSGCG